MTRTILVSSIDESTGKTAVTLALGHLARERGLSVGYMKPKGTRLQSNVGKTLDEDPMLAREVLNLDADIGDMEPVVYSPTFIEQAIRGREDNDELRERVGEAFDRLAAEKDLMLVEGSAALSTGAIIELTDPDVADELDAEVLLLSRFEEAGDVDDVLAAADAFGDRLSGVLFNAVTDDGYDRLDTDAVPFLEGRGVPVHGIVPREQDLAGVTVADLADELGAEVLTSSASTDGYVERFSVGAMGGDEALRYFRRTKDAAVITGGDRSEIHTAALEAPGVRCLLLTGGFRPPGAIVGKAEEKGVPVLLVQSDTLTTVERAEDVVQSGRTRTTATVERMGELLETHADVDGLVGSPEE